MTLSDTDSAPQLRAAIEAFIQERLRTKLDKLKPEETEERAQLEEGYRTEAWLADAAKRVGQIQLATHTLKPLHPDARGSNLHTRLGALNVSGLVGTHTVGQHGADDVVGNAAALDVFKFLMVVDGEGRSLLSLALARDEGFKRALSANTAEATEWCEAFASITKPATAPASHTLAKQLFFPIEGNAYHLLAPLFPSSLIHVAQRRMREDRFGEAAKAAREARKRSAVFPHGFREYSDLAIRKFGGTKPQNISQLNSERYGENWLLPSLPPDWRSSRVRRPLRGNSVFPSYFGRQPEVRRLTKLLKAFLGSTTYNNVHIRQRRVDLVRQICEEAREYATRTWQLDAGWTSDARCELHESEQFWLDPFRSRTDADFRRRRQNSDWATKVSRRFGNWLNGRIQSAKVAVGEAEHEQWSRDFVEALGAFEDALEGERIFSEEEAP